MCDKKFVLNCEKIDEMYSNKIYFFFWFILLSLHCKSTNCQFFVTNDTKCPDLINDIDLTVKDILHMRESPIFPVNETTRDLYCRPYKTLIPTIIKLAPCLPPFLTQVILIFGYGQRRVLKAACGTKDPAIFKFYQCIDEDYAAKLATTEAIYLNSLSMIMENATEVQMIPALCCATRKVLEDSRKIESPKCPSNSTLDISKYMHDRLTEGLDDFLTLVCSTFPDWSTCKRKWPKAVRFLMRNESKQVDFTNKTLVPTFLSIMNKLTS